MTLYNDDLKKLYEKYIQKGRFAISEIQNEFHLKRDDVYKTIMREIKLFKK